MKKILLRLAMVVGIGAIVVSATGAFFSDTETSSGNVFAAGSIDLLVDSQAHYAGLVCNGQVWVDDEEEGTTRPDLLNQSCSGTWTETDLGPTNTFFNLGDLKPGDDGENTISLHVVNNDAYVCAIVDNLQDNDNGLTEPEGDAGDSTGGPLGGGELSSELHFFAWADNAVGDGVEAGNNIWNDGEVALFSNTEGPASDVLGGVSYDLFTPNTVGALNGGDTTYIGMYWCYGDIDVSKDTHTLTCDGAPVTNVTQTDSMSADISFYVEQARNNGNFQCPSPREIGGGDEVTIADSYETGFEPGESFVLGNINAQNTWKKTGAYDAEIVNNPVIADLQSLRISNAVTSGAFGDQTFAPELSSGAGETGIGGQNHFEAQFDISSTQLAQQPGLVLSVSPDDGNGSRMSYLRFEDLADGIHVFFDDVTDTGPLGTVANFNESDIATLSRTSHTVKFVMDFVDGPGNDVVKIYIDNVLKATGTSWEDYYRYDPEQNGNGNQLFAVDTLLFRAGGTAAPTTSGKGFLFDKVLLSSGTL